MADAPITHSLLAASFLDEAAVHAKELARCLDMARSSPDFGGLPKHLQLRIVQASRPTIELLAWLRGERDL